MSLSAGMWTSVSGLLGHGEKMNVVGNNIANVSTLGFKSQRMDFHDFIYQDGFSASGPTQIGFGVGINAVMGDFSQGAFETTNSATDLAIGGNGFFQVRDENSDQVYYTRAGNFTFNTQGELHLPSGEILQGWKIDNSESPTLATGANPTVTAPSAVLGTGVPVDIVLDTWSVPPKETTNIEFSLNLTAGAGNDKTRSSTNPMFALSERWDGTEEPPLSSDAYAYPASIKVYDEGGTEHTLTTYFDQIPSDSVDDLPQGYKMYEYVVTMNPDEDLRTFGGTYDPATGTFTADPTNFSDTEAAGILMKGTITFNSSGQMVNQTAYTYMGNTDYADDQVTTMDPTDPAAWQPTAVSSNGYPVFTANFSGYALGNSVRQTSSNEYSAADDHLIEFNLGMQCTGDLDNPWGIGATVPEGGGGPSIADLIEPAAVPPAVQTNPSYADLANFISSEKEAGATTSQGDNSITNAGIQDGYTTGNLTNVHFDAEGVMYGIYSNGVTLPLYQIALYDFVDPQGLYREGGNLFSATHESGNPQIAAPQQGGMGSINAYNIEQSNVDMATEFVQMISTQRGFQANSKSITTIDTMLENVISMKR